MYIKSLTITIFLFSPRVAHALWAYCQISIVATQTPKSLGDLFTPLQLIMYEKNTIVLLPT